MIDTLRIRGILSYGWEPLELRLDSLNLLIGPNGSGKSNLLAVLDLLRAVADDKLADLVRAAGGAGEWIHKGEGGDGIARIEVIFAATRELPALRYQLGLARRDAYLDIVEELLQTQGAPPGASEASLLLSSFGGEGAIRLPDRASEQLDAVLGPSSWRDLERRRAGEPASALVKYGHAVLHAPLAHVRQGLLAMRFHLGVNMGPEAAPRRPQPADLPSHALEPNARNLGHVLSRLRRDPAVLKRLREELAKVYEGVDDFEVTLDGGTVQVLLMERGYYTPAMRLSDGTLRWLTLLCVLLDPAPPPLVAIEEPEIGLHPDLIGELGSLLRDAAGRTQLVVTTHSDALISAFTDTPEAVVVCERPFGRSTLRRLAREPLESWLENYTLGHVWRTGELGGNRW